MTAEPVKAAVDRAPIAEPCADAGANLAGLRLRLHSVLPQIAASTEQTEDDRRLPAESIALLKACGFFRAFQPRRYGGLELYTADFGPLLVDLAEACGATAWVSGLLALHVHLVSLFSRQLQDEIWGADGDALIGSSVAPVGVAEAVDGGVMLSGRFGFSSGCDHAQWFILGFKHPRCASPYNKQYAVVPRSDLTIVDDWHTAGMRGTGSKTLIVESAFVPDHRMESLFALNAGHSKGFGSNEGPIYHAAFAPHFAVGFPAVAIGVVRRMAKVYAQRTKSRINVYTGAAASARSANTMRLGRAMHANEAALAFVEKDWAAIDARCRSGQLPTADELARWRTNMAFAIQLSIQASDDLFGGSGGGAWFNSNEMQRLWRNAHMVGAHAATDYDTASEVYGKHLLGL